MHFTGNWRSDIYQHIHGYFIIDTKDELQDSFIKNDSKDTLKEESYYTFIMELHYDEKSVYKTGQSIYIELEGLFREKSNIDDYRFIFRQKDFKIDQYFTLTLRSKDKLIWQGFLTCIFPVDNVILYNVLFAEEKVEDKIENTKMTISI